MKNLNLQVFGVCTDHWVGSKLTPAMINQQRCYFPLEIPPPPAGVKITQTGQI